jgi:LysM repeat protein
MKKILIALITAIFIAGQMLSPAAAATSTASTCGDTYVVQPGDYLSLIANACGTTVADILTLNTQITNPNVIFYGMVLRLTGNAPIQDWPTYVPYYNPVYSPTTAYSGSGRVRISATRAVAGDTVTVSVSGYPAYADIDYRLGIRGDTYSVVYDGKTDAYGATSATVTIPSGASTGDIWVVEVITTGSVKVVDIISQPIYIGTYSTSTSTTYTGYARVTVSKTSVAPGGTVVVTASGFPVGAEIDYRVGVKGSSYSVVYDGTIGSGGSANQTITIPSSATVGDYWVVQVLTTSQKNVVSVTSHTIHITN